MFHRDRKLAAGLLLLFIVLPQLHAQKVPDFSLAVSPYSLSMTQGSESALTVTIETEDHATVHLATSGLPEGVEASISPLHDGMATVFLLAAYSAPTGSFAVQIVASTPGRTHVQTVTLNIKASPVIPQWEYTFIRAETPEELMNQANQLGAQAWELVNVTTDEHDSYCYAFLKRRKK